MASTQPWRLGPPGSMIVLPDPNDDPDVDHVRLGSIHELPGGRVGDTTGYKRDYKLSWRLIDRTDFSVLERLHLLPLGPYALVDPYQRNLLTENQSSGGDFLRYAEGMVARFQGVVSVSNVQAKSGTRSIAWNSQSALGSTGRGLYLYNSPTLLDATYLPVVPGVNYVSSVYARSTAAVSMISGFDWHDAAGTYFSTTLGSTQALSTTDWSTRLWFSTPAVTGAAYGIPFWLNNTTTGSAITVYFDEAMVYEGSAASLGAVEAWTMGRGVPRVRFHSFGSKAPRRFYPYRDVEATFLEL